MLLSVGLASNIAQLPECLAWHAQDPYLCLSTTQNQVGYQPVIPVLYGNGGRRIVFCYLKSSRPAWAILRKHKQNNSSLHAVVASGLPRPPLAFTEQTGWISNLRKVLAGSGLGPGSRLAGEPAGRESLIPSLQFLPCMPQFHSLRPSQGAPSDLPTVPGFLMLSQPPPFPHHLTGHSLPQSLCHKPSFSWATLGPLPWEPHLATPRILPACTCYLQ